MPSTRERDQRPRHNPIRLPCSLRNCNRSFRSQGGLTKHIRTHHPQAASEQKILRSLSQQRSPSLVAHPQAEASHAGDRDSDHDVRLCGSDGELDHDAESDSELDLEGLSNPPLSPVLSIPQVQFSLAGSSSPRSLLPNSPTTGIPPQTIQRSESEFESAPGQANASESGESDPSVKLAKHPTSHPLLNGWHSINLLFLILIYFSGRPCDEHGNFLPADSPPQKARHANADPNDWTPYRNRVEFETAQFLYCREQMSAGNINILLDLWAATLLKHNEPPPFASAADMYETIDSTPLGDIAWQSFSVTYDGDVPDSAPQWMSTEYEVWFRDPHLVALSMVDNPDYKGSFDTTPIRVFDTGPGGHRQYQNFMSGDMVWDEAVCFHVCCKHVSQASLIPGYNIKGSKYTWSNARSHYPGQ